MRADLIFLKGFVTVLCLGALSITALRAESAAQQVPEPRRPYDRLSSGAVMLLDRNGDLVQPPARRAAKSEQSFAEALVALDRRVGANIRLGDDPSALPSVMRAQAEPHIARSPTATRRSKSLTSDAPTKSATMPAPRRTSRKSLSVSTNWSGPRRKPG